MLLHEAQKHTNSHKNSGMIVSIQFYFTQLHLRRSSWSRKPIHSSLCSYLQSQPRRLPERSYKLESYLIISARRYLGRSLHLQRTARKADTKGPKLHNDEALPPVEVIGVSTLLAVGTRDSDDGAPPEGRPRCLLSPKAH